MYKKLTTAVVALLIGVGAAQAECDVRIGVAPIEAGDNIADGIQRQLEVKLQKALAKRGIVADGAYSQFFITGRFDAAYADLVGSSTASKYVVKTDLTLYIADNNGQIFASESFPLKGVGDTEERAYQKCMNSLSPQSSEFVSFVTTAKDKIVDYFNQNYQTYLSKAQTALSQRNYAEAMYYAGMVPECCVGFEAAQDMLVKIYRDYTNYDALTLLAKAQAAWNASPNEFGAADALAYLAAIDPSASCYPEAQKLSAKIGKQVRSDYEYENRTKYENEIGLEKQRIEAARAIGVAWAKSQPKTIYKTNFIYRHY